jgi:iron complex outermembrane receptor protein
VVTQVGEARSQGVELDIQGDLTRRWSILASYAFTDARVTQDQDIATQIDPFGNPVPVMTPGRTGKRLANTPEHAASLWMKYALNDAFTLAGGMFAMTEREVDADNTVDVPGYVRFDLAAAFRHRLGRSWLKTQLNVLNLFDKEYFDPQTSFARTINVSPTAPRTILASLVVEF